VTIEEPPQGVCCIGDGPHRVCASFPS
jgi:hypothetical protein